LETLASVGGEFWIQNNDQLTDVSSLMSLIDVGENMGVIYNNSLTTLDGLDNIIPESIFNLNIHNNPLLSDCAVESICNYLLNPTGEVLIHDNAPTCDSPEEVLDDCFIIPKIEGFYLESEFLISPNPCSNALTIRYMTLNSGILIFDLIDITGIKVQSITFNDDEPGIYGMEIDLSNIPAGIYFCTLKTNDGILTRKLIKL